MTPQKLWVLNAPTKTNRIDDVCQNVRQDFDIYRNIDHQKAKKLKKKQRKRNKTHKETSEQTNKQTNKQRNNKNKKNKQAMSFVFLLVRCNGWSHCALPNETNKKTTSKQSREPTQTHELYIYYLASWRGGRKGDFKGSTMGWQLCG